MSKFLMDKASKSIFVVADATPVPGGGNWVASGVLDHDASEAFVVGSKWEQFDGPALDPAGPTELVTETVGTHALWHHARDFLFANGYLDPSIWALRTDFVAVTSISALPATKTLDLSSEPTVQIETTFTPEGASNKGLTYSTSDAAVATVSATGLITAVAVGTATITVTSVADPSKTDTVAVTVQA